MLSLLALAAGTIVGHVESTAARWSSDGEVIVTESRVVSRDGAVSTVVQLGGTVDGIGMTFSDLAPVLRTDDTVDLRVTISQDRLVVTSAVVEQHTSALASGAVASYGLMHTTKSGRPLYRDTGCLHFVYDAAGSSHVPEQRELAVVDEAFATWVSGTSSCAALAFDRTIEASVPTARDGLETVHFRDDRWCRPATATEPELCYDHGASAVTRVIFIDSPQDPADGKILEADIEINAVDFALQVNGASASSSTSRVSVDLMSVVLHEIGHAMGLDHNCGSGAGAWPTDIDGNRVPACDVADSTATMFYRIDAGDISKRSLEVSDQRAACVVVEGQACVAEVEGGCSAGGAPSPALLLAGLPLRRRRKRRALFTGS